MSVIINTRGPKHGICNICGEDGLLTEDHTPPKGCIKVKQVELHHIIEHLNVDSPTSKGRMSQNGVKYRTLCKRCNSELLGIEYDPCFISFVNELGLYLKTKIQVPPAIRIKTKPQRVMRSLLGHIAAQGVRRYEKGKLTEPLRDYILDPTLVLPHSLNVYFWSYPYRSYVMARDCALTDLTIHEPVVIWFLKFFPVAFLVTLDEPEKYNFSLGCLSDHRSIGIDDEVEILVNLEDIIHPYWPEAPTEKTIIMYGQEAITSFDWKKQRRQS